VIKTLIITCFRGIPQDLEISFIGSNRSLSSVLLLGENGTGKSSVADALEFCLRGKVSRRGNAGAKIRYESRNLLVGGNPSVRVTFDDDRQFIRGVTPDDFPGVRLSLDPPAE
jgi:DNA repair exonuclease SbcCD ATPase subunit